MSQPPSSSIPLQPRPSSPLSPVKEVDVPWFKTHRPYYTSRWSKINRTTKRAKKFTVLPSTADNDDTTNKSTFTVHFMRHGEGIHNVLATLAIVKGEDKPPYHSSNIDRYPEMIDAPLTEIGRSEARAQASTTEAFAERRQPGFLVVSPLQRAIETGLLAFPHLFGSMKQGIVLANDLCRESYHSQNLCDRRRNLTVIREQFPFVDFDGVERHGEEVVHVGIDENMDTLIDRAYDFMVWLHDTTLSSGGLENKCVAVATHSVFLYALTIGVLEFEDSEDARKDFFNTGELRSFSVRVA